MHDWTRVKSGTYHSFHYRWLATIMDWLNAGALPADLFAMAEQRVGGPEPDLLTLSTREPHVSGGSATTAAAPKTSVIERAEKVHYARKTNRIAIHHDLGTVVAIIELVSPGNKDTKHALRSFCRKSAAFIRNGVHVSVIDPFPPGRYDPQGIHPAIWSNVTSTEYQQPTDRPLTLAAYQASECPTAFVEPFASGQPLPDLPLFLDDDVHINVPLEETYLATWKVLPVQIRTLLE